ncbi:MAG: NUDIX domain-containing protein [Chloroflexota bacterium]
MREKITKVDDSYFIYDPTLPLRTSAGGVVVRKDLETGQLLYALVREKGYGKYVLPKGGVEEGETFEQAAIREIGEEAGIHQLTLIKKLAVLERLVVDKTRWVHIHLFLFVTSQVDFSPTDPEHEYSPEWRSFDDTSDLFWPDQKRLVEEMRADIEETVSRI